ncbi:MAG: tRNA lysidine(34) synthetase TilS [Bdellovibrionales bacterium]
MGLTSEEFDHLMARSFEGVFGDARDNAFYDAKAFAVGVSGGPDSMALLWLLQDWCARHDKVLHVLSVDHCLRQESLKECRSVEVYCAQFDHVFHEILVWDVPSHERVQEEARKARYDLMSRYCLRHEIQHLFLAHHCDDQAETVLFRLAKGSGLDGLAGMRPLQLWGQVALCRPVLDVSKDDLLEVCTANAVPFIEDPSNKNDAFARVRLRQSMDVLSAEGLSVKRLSVTAKRLMRARDALDQIAAEIFNENLTKKETNRIEFNVVVCRKHAEIVLRVLQRCFEEIGAERDYAPRMEKLEDLVLSLKHDIAFRKRTLGGIVFERNDKKQVLILTTEKRNNL